MLLTAEAVSDMMFLGVTEAGGYTIGNKLNTGDEIVDIFEFSKILYDEGYTLGHINDATATAAAISEGQVFCTSKPTWGLNYSIIPNFPEQSGDWGLTAGPYPYTAGGTWIGISKDTDYKEECYIFVKYILSDLDFVRSYALGLGDYVSNITIQDEIGEYTAQDGEDLNIFTFLNGQNPYKFWNSELDKGIDSNSFSPYDEYFGNYLVSSVESYALGNSTLEEAIEQYKKDCQSYAPSIEVE